MSTASSPLTGASTDELVAAARAIADAGRIGAEMFGRADRAGVQAQAIIRLDRPTTLIAVIGEFKQGKSSLINALLERDVAPVDDDIATAVLTLFQYGESERALAFTANDDGETSEEIRASELESVVSERSNPENARAIDRVEVSLPAELLVSGAVLVDTPGFGGLAPGYGGMTLAYLKAVDAVVFVSDASAPLWAPEVAFLQRAVEACPAVLMALTKIDLYPAWREVRALDEGTLEELELEAPVLPLSSLLARHAEQGGDEDVLAQSGMPDLADTLRALVLGSARGLASRRALDETAITVSQLRTATVAELAAAEDPASGEELSTQFAASRAKLDALRGPGARWAQVLGDGFSDLFGEADFHFRSGMREVTRTFEDEIEAGGDPGRKWDELTARLRDRVGAVADRMVDELEDGARRIQETIAQLLADEEGVALAPAPKGQLDVGGLWTTKPLERIGVGKGTDLAFSGLRGGQSGISTIKLIASLAGVGVSAAATAGIGFAFAGKQLLDERKRHLQAKRQQARNAVRQFTEDVQFEASKRMRDLVRDLQRAQRDYFSDRIGELQRTATESLNAVQAAMDQSASERARLAADLRQRVAQLDELEARRAQIAAAL